MYEIRAYNNNNEIIASETVKNFYNAVKVRDNMRNAIADWNRLEIWCKLTNDICDREVR